MTVSSNYSAYSSYGSSAASTQRMQPNFEQMAQKLLSSMDSNNNGSIDKAEFSAAAQALASNSNGSNSSTSTIEDIFNTLDTNSDGSMSSQELLSALQNMTPPPPPPDSSTQHGDGPPPPPPPSQSDQNGLNAQDILSALDTNKDGTVTIDELLAVLDNSNNQNQTSATQQSNTNEQRMSDHLLQKIISAYGNDTTTNSTNSSLLSLSA